MTTNRAMELLYDSEASLRLVDHELDALREFSAGVQEVVTPPPVSADGDEPFNGMATAGLAMVPMILQRANAEIVGVLQSLRQCRSALETATSDRLQITHEKIREVTSATELAATDMLDGLDRAQGLIDNLDSEADTHGEGSSGAKELRTQLREELFTLTGCLQFQDITTQQLTYTSTVLIEMEARLSEIARLFDPRRYGAPELPPEPAVVPTTFTRDASLVDAEGRQAIADAIFVGPKRRG